MTDSLPPGLAAYRRTPVFTEATLPAGLRHRHHTKPGVWALITVLEGRLRLRRLASGAESELGPAAAGVVAPEEPHEVEPLGPVRFFVEFHAAPTQDAPLPRT
jgi:tellurite methyltransferase